MKAPRAKAGALARHIVFSLLPAVLLFSIFELGFALAGVRPLLVEQDPYVGFEARVPLFVEDPEAIEFKGIRNLVTAPNKRAHFNVQRFSTPKAAGVTRIFCVGGSTTYGRPYADTTSFCGWLRAFLEAAAPDARFELINAGGISYASYRVALLMEELAQYEPDWFVIYSGHNEFLEERTYAGIRDVPAPVRWLGSVAARTRIYTAMRALVDAARDGADPAAETHALPAEVEPLLDRSIGPAAYSRDDTLAANVLAHYRFNLSRMIAIARAAGASTVLVEPAANLRDFSPFKSDASDGLRPEQEAQRDALSQQARNASDPETRLARLDAALAIDPRNAGLHFRRARALLALGREPEASDAFWRACDEDVCPLRIPSAFARALREVASDEEVPLIAYPQWLAARAAHGIPGDDLFLDHVHPSIDANRGLGRLLLDRFESEGVVRVPPGFDEEAVAARVEASIDEAAHGRALRNLAKVLAWAGKFEEADRLALEAVKLSPRDAGAHFQAGNAHHRAGRLGLARHHYERSVRLRPDDLRARLALARILARVGRFDESAREYEEVVRQRPDTASLRLGYARVLFSAGRSEQALAQAERALALDPSLAAARRLRERLRADARSTGAPGDL